MAELKTIARRLRTGVAGLDELLGGGLLAGRSVLIKGPPGSGKTTLGLQILAAGAAQFGEPGILLTFEQAPGQLFADAASFGWDMEGLMDQKRLQVLFVRPQEVLDQPGRQDNRLLAMLEDWAEETGARRVLIDSISHIRALYTGEQARAMFLNFVLKLKTLSLTPIMTSELSGAGDGADLDAYLVDTVIEVARQGGAVGQAPRRELTVVKTRGHGHIQGAHPFEIGEGGITVYPHSYPPPAAQGAESHEAPALPTGIAGLDRLLGGGYTSGSCVLAAGLSGTFKTTLAAHFLMAGVADGAPGLWIALQESAADLERCFARIGMDLRGARQSGRLAVLECTPGREPIEKTVQQAERLIAQRAVKRVALDSLGDLTMGIEGAEGRQEAALWLLRRLRAQGATTLYTQRLSRAVGPNPLSEIEGPELADTIIYLGLVEIESRLEKVISVLKHRGAPAEGDLRSVSYTDRGLEVSERFIGLTGVLAGTARGQRKAQIENVFQPLYFIRDFLTLAKDPSLEPGRREQLLKNLSSQTEKVIGVLGRYFDEPTRKGAGEAPKQGP